MTIRPYQMLQLTATLFNLLPDFVLLQAQADDEEFNLFLFSILVLGLTFMFISLLIALLLTAIGLMVIFGFIGIGAVSASVLVGISQKSFTAGFRWFAILFCSVSLSVVGAGTFWFLNRILHWWSQTKAIVLGLSIGMVSGIAAGFCIAYLIKKLSAFLKAKLDKKNNPSIPTNSNA
ncbi:hypothetical protein [Flavobacterium sp.]|uniref:hypothetical protein n=1 Tax=Flavobacterium sp. TaxID=239 RepID=UPI0039E52768